MKLYVGNLVYNMTEAQLSDLFSTCGKVVKAKIITDFFTRQSKNFGYVEMATSADAQKAMHKLNGKTVSNRLLVVKEAQI